MRLRRQARNAPRDVAIFGVVRLGGDPPDACEPPEDTFTQEDEYEETRIEIEFLEEGW